MLTKEEEVFEGVLEKLAPKYAEEILQIKSDRIRGEVLDFIGSVPFVFNLCRRDRKRARDLEKDKNGKVIVDLTRLHILEDMDYFRPAALFYEKHGVYTHLYYNTAPQSEYRKFWDEESRRCREGYVRESDGEWIPGEFYWYLNYCPIMKAAGTEEVEYDPNLTTEELFAMVEAERVSGFPAVWDGDYLYFHYRDQARKAGKHCTVLKTRGRGYSFKGAAVLSMPYFHLRDQNMYAMASENEYLTTDGLLNKTWDVLNFVDNTTPWYQPREYKDTTDEKRASYKDPDLKIERGRKNSIIGVTLKNNPEKARGKRGREILWEEAGKFPGLLTAWTIALGSLQQGRLVFGMMTAFGTGGTEGADFAAMVSLFYEGDSYSVYTLPNVFDRNSESSRCALYIGEYLNREFCYDHNGNSNPVKALVEIFLDRSTKNADAIVQHKADYSLTPQEAVMRKEGSLFPILDLKDYLAEISPKMASFTAGHHVGRLGYGGDKIVWQLDAQHRPIREFPLKDGDKTGAIEIFEMPKSTASGNIPFGRYIAGCDPYDHDDSTTDSLGSLLVYDTFLDEIVCEYTGRPQTAAQFYENVLRIMKFYNGICNYENANKGLFTYFSQHNALHHLADTPKILKQVDLVKGDGFGNKAKGTPPTKGINAWARKLGADWLVTQWEGQQEATDEEGNPLPTEPIPNLRRLRSIGLINELIRWNPDINADRVSAFGMLMILKEDRAKINVDAEDSYNPFNSNSFWDKRYRNRHRNRF